MTRRIVLVGASGVFGERLASLIAPWPDVTLVLAARRAAPLRALAQRLGGRVEVAVFDRGGPETLATLEPWAVVDAAGPFQGAGYRLALAAVKSGAHYV
ncbi:MAG TPA: saccharopine dehydrogenase NADP-binding domain-containing protein, partial [Caulobacteraceae bacterium]|nr:saccharopine dehydrogenase NADP-binding domain-containing protein [Caulobacteraceae bacterium]